MPQFVRDEMHRQQRHSHTSSVRDRNADHNRMSSSRRSPVKRTTMKRRQESKEQKTRRNSSSSMKRTPTAQEDRVHYQQQKGKSDHKRVDESSSTRQTSASKHDVPPPGDERRPKLRRCSPLSKNASEGGARKLLRLDVDHDEKKETNKSAPNLMKTSNEEGKQRTIGHSSISTIHGSSRLRQGDGPNGGVSSSALPIPTKKENNKQSRKENALLTDGSFANSGFSTNNKDDEFAVNSFANAGFGSSNLFGNSGFANQGFSSTAPSRDRNDHSRLAHKQGDNVSSKNPRILPPTVPSAASANFARHKNGNQQSQRGTFNVIVNELSEGSIKREEHPLKGFAKLANRANRGQSFASRRSQGVGDGAGTFVGGASQQQRGIGQRDGMNASSRYNWSTGEVRTTTVKGNKQNFINAGFSHLSPLQQQNRRHQQKSNNNNYSNVEQLSHSPAVAAPDKTVQSSVVVVGANASAAAGGLQNPLSVPRGRNYFLHDARDDDPTMAAVSHHPKTVTKTAHHKLYDPRMDRGGKMGGGVSAGGVYKRGAGHQLGDRDAVVFSDLGLADHNRGGRAEAMEAAIEGTQQQPPLGWRNHHPFGGGGGDMASNEQQSFSFSSRRRFSGTFFDRNGNDGRVTDASYIGWRQSLPHRRSKADDDRVWSHDKFFEAEQAETKLELVDEVSACAVAAVKSSEYESPLSGKHQSTEISSSTSPIAESKPTIKEATTATSSSIFEEDMEELLYD